MSKKSKKRKRKRKVDSGRSKKRRKTVKKTRPKKEVTKVAVTRVRKPEQKINDPKMRKCYSILLDLMSIDHAQAFLTPVPWKQLQLKNYIEIVKTPMDLGTIKKACLENEFDNCEHFADHVRLVFQNSMKYNLVGSALHNVAQSLLNRFEKAYHEFDMEGRVPNQITKEHNPLEEKLKEEIKQIESEIEATNDRIKYLVKAVRRPRINTITMTEPQKPPTYEEKLEICSVISTRMDEDALAGLVAIIPHSGSGDVEIDIGGMDDHTLIKVKKYVDKYLASSPGAEVIRTNVQPLDNNAKLELAQAHTNDRIIGIKRRLKGISELAFFSLIFEWNYEN
eukprot:TRINITY_DN2375_c0_g1_i2.p1 TRINITY_DN2375_c0_g1~~TRINITY_DN2375_c0_g1_i2.p1  ORF type:complete len:337 (-),score=80.42 TRINITY_DN2375_c0_g1_i2:394-1404(-)